SRVGQLLVNRTKSKCSQGAAKHCDLRKLGEPRMGAPRVGFSPHLVLTFVLAALAMSRPAWSQATPGAPPAPAAPAGISAPELNPAARVPRPTPRDTDIFIPEPPGPC